MKNKTTKKNKNDLIYAFMQKKGITREEFISKTGLTKPTMNSILMGTTNPSFDSIQKVADTLGVTINDIYPSEFTDPAQLKNLETIEKLQKDNEKLKETISTFANKTRESIKEMKKRIK